MTSPYLNRPLRSLAQATTNKLGFNLVAIGSIEVFKVNSGFYWWPHEPDGMPQGKAIGPFHNAWDAWQNAREQ